jgi:hypothetical protein
MQDQQASYADESNSNSHAGRADGRTRETPVTVERGVTVGD